jgi:hypothetical protein
MVIVGLVRADDRNRVIGRFDKRATGPNEKRIFDRGDAVDGVAFRGGALLRLASSRGWHFRRVFVDPEAIRGDLLECRGTLR